MVCGSNDQRGLDTDNLVTLLLWENCYGNFLCNQIPFGTRLFKANVIFNKTLGCLGRETCHLFQCLEVQLTCAFLKFISHVHSSSSFPGVIFLLWWLFLAYSVSPHFKTLQSITSIVILGTLLLGTFISLGMLYWIITLAWTIPPWNWTRQGSFIPYLSLSTSFTFLKMLLLLLTSSFGRSVPLKVRYFSWTAILDKVTTNNLRKRQRPHKALPPDVCVMCFKIGETLVSAWSLWIR